jgi:hypothetical protein
MPEPVLRASEYMRTPQVDMLLLGRGEQMRERSANRRTFKTSAGLRVGGRVGAHTIRGKRAVPAAQLRS